MTLVISFSHRLQSAEMGCFLGMFTFLKYRVSVADSALIGAEAGL